MSSVELEVELSDSVLARGLEGCRLAANLASDSQSDRAISIRRGPFPEGTFWCASNDSTDADLVEFGHAVFRPGDVTVPLYLSQSLVDELQDINLGGDSTPPVSEARADSITAAFEVRAESAHAVQERMVDSLRAEGLRRVDSARRVLTRVADSTRSR